jgi:hypothetical protein
VIRSHYGNGFLKQYVRDHLCLRTELATNDVTDYGIKKAVENLPPLRDKLATICDNYLTVQQDILETFVDRCQLRKLTEPTVLPYVLAALQMSADQYSLASLRYDLSKLRAKELVEKLPKSRRYRLCPQGYCICLVFLKLFERIYAPLAAGLLQPYRADAKLKIHNRTQLDRLYQKVIDDLDELVGAVGLKAA